MEGGSRAVYPPLGEIVAVQHVEWRRWSQGRYELKKKNPALTRASGRHLLIMYGSKGERCRSSCTRSNKHKTSNTVMRIYFSELRVPFSITTTIRRRA